MVLSPMLPGNLSLSIQESTYKFWYEVCFSLNQVHSIFLILVHSKILKLARRSLDTEYKEISTGDIDLIPGTGDTDSI